MQKTTLHAELIDVFGIGVLLLGKSGLGKSECALDLVLRGHRLVADDLVQINKVDENIIEGRATELGKHHMEIRGLGIINIQDLFGVAAIREQKKIEIVVELVEWNVLQAEDRLGMEECHYDILEVALPHVRIPVRPGRNLASIVEVAARNQLLKLKGHHSAHKFDQKLNRQLAKNIEKNVEL